MSNQKLFLFFDAMEEIVEKIYSLPDNINLMLLYGGQDENIRLIEEQVGVRLIARGHKIKILGTEDAIQTAISIFDDIVHTYERHKKISPKDIITSIQISRLNVSTSQTINDYKGNLNGILVTTPHGYIKAKTGGQIKLAEAIKKNDIVFAVGPAGTGKTYLAVAMAVAALKEQRVKKIILARPAVEAGERLGYLPGDFKDKIDPYLKPLYDALEDMLPLDQLRKFLDQEVVEIIPLAFMRGRTLNNAFVILDEAQNSTFMQMKMFLTRLGQNAKAVITGDVTQIDLADKKNSGLITSIRILSNIGGIAIVKLSKKDVVRHQLVRDIIAAYDKYSGKEEARENKETLLKKS